ncbi:MAG: bifunctional helix-turn-helix domain-containing protein/methylated-DNA--[protein]-cysteine S-methyltransferase [Spirochaetes bacterium]|nr:bifunctional helix-turn-helix domain-containing protein/methylated-DNA--[protein]-cysteine S-methyltransferase [Spirochaetota bacterium]
MTHATKQAAADYARVERAIRFLGEQAEHRPSLAEVARSAGLSPAHFQRLFTRWAGISPKRFLQFLAKEYAVEQLRRSVTVLDAAWDAGLSGPGRLHDLLVSAEAATPGEVASGGRGVSIAWGFHPTPFGECLLGITARGICHLSFVGAGGRAAALAGLRRRWPRATLREDHAIAARMVERMFAGTGGGKLGLHLAGTNFQLKVWEALLRIPPGAATTYGDVARRIGRPGAARAVAGAVGANPVAWIIPCHRVLRSIGTLGGYRWGLERKQAMLGWEAARTPLGPPGRLERRVQGG